MSFPRNNSELQQRLRELESLFELLPVGVAISRDSECRTMTANAVFCDMMGVAHDSNPSKTGANADRLPFRVVKNGVEVPPENLPLQVAAREGIPVRGSCEILRDDGTTVFIQGQTVPLIDAEGMPCGSVGVFVNVTERENLIRELQAAQDAVKTLTGLLPICAHCKKIRDRDDRWVQFEVYVREHSNADFSHGICPTCLAGYDGNWSI